MMDSMRQLTSQENARRAKRAEALRFGKFVRVPEGLRGVFERENMQLLEEQTGYDAEGWETWGHIDDLIVAHAIRQAETGQIKVLA